jgi:hypothetical protein
MVLEPGYWSPFPAKPGGGVLCNWPHQSHRLLRVAFIPPLRAARQRCFSDRNSSGSPLPLPSRRYTLLGQLLGQRSKVEKISNIYQLVST